MYVTYCRVDVSTCLARKQRPAAVVSRQPGENWLVSYDAVRMDQPLVLTPTEHGDSVHIPLVPYLTRPEPDLFGAFMLQLGAKIGSEIGRPIRQMHLVIGNPVNEVQDRNGAGLQCFIGFGVVLEG